jgi:hypothetical protein
MPDRLERLIKLVYKQWRAGYRKTQDSHPDEEDIACFLEGRLTKEENDKIKEHLIICDRCAEAVSIQLRLKTAETKELPAELMARVKNLVIPEDKTSVLEILLRIKERMLEVVNTTGDVLVGNELVPAPVLRSRKIKDFKDEITILRDFKDIRVEVKIENKQGRTFNLTVAIKEKETQKVIKDLRVTLLKEEREMESYLADSGKVTFENVLLGKYIVEVSNLENKLASILIDIKT